MRHPIPRRAGDGLADQHRPCELHELHPQRQPHGHAGAEPHPDASATASLTPDASLCPAWLMDDFDDPARDLGGSARTDLMGGQWAVQASSASLTVAYGGSGANGTPHALRPPAA